MKSKKMLYVSITLVVVTSLLIGALFIFNQQKADDGQVPAQGVRTPYKLPKQSTELQQMIFKDLQAAYEANNHEAVAACIGQLMLSDFFNLSNKSSRSQVGGMQYLLDDEDFRRAFFTQALNNYYGFFEELKLEYGQDQLPTVTAVQWLETEESEFYYGDMVFDQVIKMSYVLEYDATKSYDISTLYLNYSVTMVSINNIWYVVQIDVV